MKDLTDPKWIKFKGLLFLLLGLVSALLLYAEQKSLKTALLLAISIWGFCRFYYFAFYVLSTMSILVIAFPDCSLLPSTWLENAARRSNQRAARRQTTT